VSRLVGSEMCIRDRLKLAEPIAKSGYGEYLKALIGAAR
jgi:hypothetical protein